MKWNEVEVASYAYDVSGQMIYSEVEGLATYYIFSVMGNNVYEEEAEKSSKYIYLNGKKIIEVKGKAGERDEVYYYQQDQLGSTSLVIDQDGQVVANQEYLPFVGDLNQPGVPGSEGSYQSRYKYTGQYHQYEIGLYYYGARFYDPRVGRFITEDTYLGEVTRPKSQHLYLYVLNNPMRYVDPTGHEPYEVDNDSDWELYDYQEGENGEDSTVFLNELNQIMESTKITNDDGTTIIINKYFPAGGRTMDHEDIKVYNAEGKLVMFQTMQYSNPDTLLDNVPVTGRKATAGYYMGEAGKWVAKEMDKVEDLKVSNIVGFQEKVGDIIDDVPLAKVTNEVGENVVKKGVAKSAGFWISAADFVKNEADIVLDSNLSVSQKFHKGGAELVYSATDIFAGMGAAAAGSFIGGPVGTCVGIGISVGISIKVSSEKEKYYLEHGLE